MIIFWRLLLSHLLADFTLQFNYVNKLKRKSMWGMIIHCMTHFVMAVVLTYRYLGETWVNVFGADITGWGAVFILLFFHFVTDELRVWAMRRGIFRDNTASFLLDQFIHAYVLFMISPLSTAEPGWLEHEKWVLIFTMLVMVTHATTVLIYFIEKDLKGRSFPNFDEKYFLIFERTVILGFFFVQGYWWLIFLGAWIFQIFYVRKKRIIDLSLINIVVSVLVACVLGLLTRYIYYGGI